MLPPPSVEAAVRRSPKAGRVLSSTCLAAAVGSLVLFASQEACDGRVPPDRDPATDASGGGSGSSGSGWQSTGECFPMVTCHGDTLVEYPGYDCSHIDTHCEQGCVMFDAIGAMCVEPGHPCPRIFDVDPWADAAFVADCNGDPADGAEADLRTDASSCGACGRACVTSSCSDGLCAPQRLAADVYGTSSLTQDGDALFLASSWAKDPDRIFRVAKDGSAWDVFASHPEVSISSISADLTIDGSWLLWRSHDGLRKKPKDGSATAVGMVEGPAGAANALVTYGGTAFWLAGYPTPSLYHMPVDGGVAVDLGPVPGARALAVYGDAVFLATTDSIVTISVAGGPSQVVVAGLAEPWDVAADETGVYWVDRAAGTVARASLDGSGVAVLAEAQPRPIRIALDTANVYWLDAGSERTGPRGGAIVRAPKSGGAPSTLYCVGLDPDEPFYTWDEPSRIAVDESRVYVATGLGIVAVTR